MSFSLVVSAGTYHFGFDRLMDWTESWLDQHPEAEATVQHGTSRTVRGATNREIIPHPELLELYRSASVIVLQGGAGGIMDARELGIVPIVVPRVPVGDEVVDDHQVVFGRRLRDFGLVHLAETEAALHQLLDRAQSGTLPVRPEHQPETPGPTAVAARLDALMASPAPGRRWGQGARRLTSRRAWRRRAPLPDPSPEA